MGSDEIRGSNRIAFAVGSRVRRSPLGGGGGEPCHPSLCPWHPPWRLARLRSLESFRSRRGQRAGGELSKAWRSVGGKVIWASGAHRRWLGDTALRLHRSRARRPRTGGRN